MASMGVMRVARVLFVFCCWLALPGRTRGRLTDLVTNLTLVTT